VDRAEVLVYGAIDPPPPPSGDTDSGSGGGGSSGTCFLRILQTLH
jgi:hypothetical protein